MDNILTVDVEEWFYANALNIQEKDLSKYDSRVVEQSKQILELLDRYNTQGTFFVLGCVAQRHPNLVREIVMRGHSIASHGMNHQLVYQQTDQQFREDIRSSKRILEDISGTSVQAYRAPSWSITKNYFHRLCILEEEGYLYDSSLQPFWTPLSGSNRTPTHPFNPIINGRQLNLIEVPPTIMKIANVIPFPFLGGFYLRFIPLWLITRALKHLNRGQNGMVYVHPWEFDQILPKIQVSMLTTFVHYYNIKSTKAKLEKLLINFDFKPLEVIVKKEQCPSVPL